MSSYNEKYATKQEVASIVARVYLSCSKTTIPAELEDFMTKLGDLIDRCPRQAPTSKTPRLIREDIEFQFRKPFSPQLVPIQSEFQTCLTCNHPYVNQSMTNEEIASKTEASEQQFKTKKAAAQAEGRTANFRRSKVIYNLCCYCCTINCLASKNCPLCDENGSKLVSRINDMQMCVCDICSCTCCAIVASNKYREAREVIQHQKKQSSTYFEIKESVMAVIQSPKLRAAIEKDMIEDLLIVPPIEQQNISAVMPPKNQMLPSGRNIMSLFHSVPSILPPSFKTQPMSSNNCSSSDCQVLDSPLPSHPRELPFKKEICKFCMARILRKESNDAEKSKLQSLLMLVEAGDQKIGKLIDTFIKYHPEDLSADSELTKEELQDLIEFLVRS